MEYSNERGEILDIGTDGEVRGRRTDPHAVAAPVHPHREIDHGDGQFRSMRDDPNGEGEQLTDEEREVQRLLDSGKGMEYDPGDGISQRDKSIILSADKLERELENIEGSGSPDSQPEFPNNEELVQEAAGADPADWETLMDMGTTMDFEGTRIGGRVAIEMAKRQGLSLNSNSEIVQNGKVVGRVEFDRNGLTGKARNIRIIKYRR